jgi:hypothetical protein
MTVDPDPEGVASPTALAPTLVEDLLLLLFQPRSGTIAGETTLYYVLAGAVLADLGFANHVRTTPRAGTTEVAAVVDSPPADSLQRSAWDYLVKKPRHVQTVLAAIGPGLRGPVIDRLVARGDLRRARRKAFGLFETDALAEGDTGRRGELLARMRAALVDGAEVEPRMGALIALVSGSGTLPQFDRDIPWTSAVITRAKAFEQGNWGADAAAEAVTRTMTAIIVNNVVVAAAVLPRG